LVGTGIALVSARQAVCAEAVRAEGVVIYTREKEEDKDRSVQHMAIIQFLLFLKISSMSDNNLGYYRTCYRLIKNGRRCIVQVKRVSCLRAYKD
jgi:hypothetical protein